MATRYFNPRTREGCDLWRRLYGRCGHDFNPRTREGCDGVILLLLGQHLRISIHAPVKGATKLKSKGTIGLTISIHAPVKGATRHLMGVDVVAGKISIHAPVKGATGKKTRKKDLGMNFNPRTREGCDLQNQVKLYNNRYFNPRTREGCDPDRSRRPGRHFHISIHAPVKGATRTISVGNLSFHDISIHAPVKGATRRKISSRSSSTFQSTHP